MKSHKLSLCSHQKLAHQTTATSLIFLHQLEHVCQPHSVHDNLLYGLILIYWRSLCISCLQAKCTLSQNNLHKGFKNSHLINCPLVHNLSTKPFLLSLYLFLFLFACVIFSIFSHLSFLLLSSSISHLNPSPCLSLSSSFIPPVSGLSTRDNSLIVTPFLWVCVGPHKTAEQKRRTCAALLFFVPAYIIIA